MSKSDINESDGIFAAMTSSAGSCVERSRMGGIWFKSTLTHIGAIKHAKLQFPQSKYRPFILVAWTHFYRYNTHTLCMTLNATYSPPMVSRFIEFNFGLTVHGRNMLASQTRIRSRLSLIWSWAWIGWLFSKALLKPLSLSVYEQQRDLASHYLGYWDQEKAGRLRALAALPGDKIEFWKFTATSRCTTYGFAKRRRKEEASYTVSS